MHLKKRNCLKIYFIILGILVYFLCSKIYKTESFKNDNPDLINRLLHYSNAHLFSGEDSILNDIISVGFADIKNPQEMIYNSFMYPIEDKKFQVFYYHENDIKIPRVYIYSTHPTEKYATGSFNVVDASHILQSKLNALGIETLVEERSASDYISEHNLDYSESYTATQDFLKNALKQYNSFDLIIDLHRDSVSASVPSSVTINDKSYAKVMFVMNKNYTSNMAYAKVMNSFLSNNYAGITRGIYDKYINTFNQDLSPNNMLIELGTSANTKEEIENSIDALVAAIKENIREE